MFNAATIALLRVTLNEKESSSSMQSVVTQVEGG